LLLGLALGLIFFWNSAIWVRNFGPDFNRELCGAFFMGVRWTLGCFFCGGQMDFAVIFLWWSDGLCGAFLLGLDGLCGAFFVPVLNRQGFHLR